MTITEIQTKIRKRAKASRKGRESEAFYCASLFFDTAHNRMPREWWALNFKEHFTARVAARAGDNNDGARKWKPSRKWGEVTAKLV